MPKSSSIVFTPADAELWKRLINARHQQQLPQALLWIVPSYADANRSLEQLKTIFLCTAPDVPCGKCIMCHKILQNTHPDIHNIQPETPGGQIKIEQIRELQQRLFQTPQIGERGLAILRPADAMNTAAASALLKILEEPPATMAFILVTTQPDLLLPTLRSRCQQYRMTDAMTTEDPLALGALYLEGSTRVTLQEQRLQWLADFDDYVEGSMTACTLAARWSDYSLYDTIRFLYVLTAKLIQRCIVRDQVLETEYHPFKLFKHRWEVTHLFQQLEGLSAMMAQLQRNMNLNTTLALEKLLLTYRENGASSC